MKKVMVIVGLFLLIGCATLQVKESIGPCDTEFFQIAVDLGRQLYVDGIIDSSVERDIMCVMADGEVVRIEGTFKMTADCLFWKGWLTIHGERMPVDAFRCGGDVTL